MTEAREWTAKPEQPLAIPAEYARCQANEVTILSSKAIREFRCASYEVLGPVCKFHDVLIDTSERNARGKVTLQRVSYHPEVILANTGFMAVPVPKNGASEPPAD